MDFSQLRWFLPPSKRAMVFVDGENLVCRFQEMVSSGSRPHPETQHRPDVFVWQRGFSHLVAASHDVLRTYYYTSAIGDDDYLAAIHDELAAIEFMRHQASNGSGYLLPRVFKRAKGTVRSKGVDIALAVELLGNATRKNVDAVLLLSGDGDFVPLVEEVMRHGVTVHLGKR